MINTDIGLRGVDPATLEAATGLGMTGSQRFWRVKVPLALPVIVTGVRSAAVEVIGSATLAAFVGAGRLGTFITSGITLMDERMLLSGALWSRSSAADGVDPGTTGGSPHSAWHGSGISQARHHYEMCCLKVRRTRVVFYTSAAVVA